MLKNKQQTGEMHVKEGRQVVVAIDVVHLGRAEEDLPDKLLERRDVDCGACLQQAAHHRVDQPQSCVDAALLHEVVHELDGALKRRSGSSGGRAVLGGGDERRRRNRVIARRAMIGWAVGRPGRVLGAADGGRVALEAGGVERRLNPRHRARRAGWVVAVAGGGVVADDVRRAGVAVVDGRVGGRGAGAAARGAASGVVENVEVLRHGEVLLFCLFKRRLESVGGAVCSP